MKMSICAFVIAVCCSLSWAQSCRPAELNYIVRDQKGNVLSESALKTIYKQEKVPGFGVGTVALTKEGTLIGYTANKPAEMLPVIYVANAATCRVKVGEFTLEYGGRQMHLIFDLDIDRRAYTIDSLPFRPGTFRLDQKGLAD